MTNNRMKGLSVDFEVMICKIRSYVTKNPKINLDTVGIEKIPTNKRVKKIKRREITAKKRIIIGNIVKER